MKKYLFFFALAFSLNAAAKSAPSHIPTPILYQLSKKILTETQHFISDNDAKPAVKAKMVKAKPLPCPLKCQPKKDQKIKNPVTFGLGSQDNLWKTDADS